MLRSAWLAQEILTTFAEGEVAEVTLAPQFAEPGGEFVVFCDDEKIWDRRADGGFPEAKQLKQRLRDVIQPDRSLGHSDIRQP